MDTIEVPYPHGHHGARSLAGATPEGAPPHRNVSRVWAARCLPLPLHALRAERLLHQFRTLDRRALGVRVPYRVGDDARQAERAAP